MQEAKSIVLPSVAFVKPTDNQIKRFWSKVDIKGSDECWEWKGGKDRDGYGYFSFSHTKQYKAHAFSFFVNGGTFEDGPCVRHVVCRNRSCVNPSHLKAGTHQDNVADRERDGTTAKGDNHSSRTCPEARPRGEGVVWSVLTNEIVIEMRALFKTGDYTIAELARKFDFNPGTVRGAVKGPNWSHLPRP